MQQIRGDKLQDGKTEIKEEARKYSVNYFRRSMVKCIQNFVDKSQSLELIEQLKNDKKKVFGKKKHFDYVPVHSCLFREQLNYVTSAGVSTRKTS